MTRKWNLPLTYEPKIAGVCDGTIRQTIRVGRKFSPGDLVSFHGWSGRPYRSPWSFRTPYAALKAVIPITILPRGIEAPREFRPWSLLAGTSERGCCPECGAPWRRVVEINVLEEKARKDHPSSIVRHGAPLGYGGGVPKSEHITTGWQPSCTCGTEETVPCVVLDPFGGSGTVAKVARDLGRSSILIEINPEYVQIAKKRLRIGEQLDSGVCEYVVKNFRPEATS